MNWQNKADKILLQIRNNSSFRPNDPEEWKYLRDEVIGGLVRAHEKLLHELVQEFEYYAAETIYTPAQLLANLNVRAQKAIDKIRAALG